MKRVIVSLLMLFLVLSGNAYSKSDCSTTGITTYCQKVEEKSSSTPYGNIAVYNACLNDESARCNQIIAENKKQEADRLYAEYNSECLPDNKIEALLNKNKSLIDRETISQLRSKLEEQDNNCTQLADNIALIFDKTGKYNAASNAGYEISHDIFNKFLQKKGIWRCPIDDDFLFASDLNLNNIKPVTKQMLLDNKGSDISYCSSNELELLKQKQQEEIIQAEKAKQENIKQNIYIVIGLIVALAILMFILVLFAKFIGYLARVFKKEYNKQ